MPRFVILEHDHPFLHWDLLLETDDLLATWRLLECPQEQGSESAAEQLSPHRREYLDYEGAVSNNRGTVFQWDSGDYSLKSQTATQWEFTLQGNRLSGNVLLKLQCGDASKWRFQFTATNSS